MAQGREFKSLQGPGPSCPNPLERPQEGWELGAGPGRAWHLPKPLRKCGDWRESGCGGAPPLRSCGPSRCYSFHWSGIVVTAGRATEQSELAVPLSTRPTSRPLRLQLPCGARAGSPGPRPGPLQPAPGGEALTPLCACAARSLDPRSSSVTGEQGPPPRGWGRGAKNKPPREQIAGNGTQGALRLGHLCCGSLSPPSG